jgi:RNA polymerase sigma-B factor
MVRTSPTLPRKQRRVSTAIRALPRQERQALILHVNDDLKQTEIAARLGCSQMQVSRLLRRAADRLRQDRAG